MRKLFLFVGILSLTALLSCESNRWDADVSGITIDQEIKRFDKELFNVDFDSIWSMVPLWEKEYGYFFEAYNQQVIRIGGTNQLDYKDKLIYFLTDPDIQGVHEMVERQFVNLDFEEELTEGFKRFNYHFPNYEIPDIITHVSGFNQSIIIDSGYIAVGLDKYLGSNNKYYQMLRTPKYIRSNMHPAKINSDVFYALAIGNYPFKSKSDNLISQMIYYGKIHHFVDAMLPQAADTLKWGYSKDQLDWCEKNERQMWLYLVENKQIFNSDYKEIKRYIDEGPFTATFSKQSPGKVGRWLGYQIVADYLKQNPKLSLEELMLNNNAQEILSQSKYRP